MNRDGLLGDILNGDDLTRLHALAESEDDNFVRMIDALGMDRRRHFRFVDLSGVDFTDCDLRGFDFTGADLRGASGRNVSWDDTTIFTGADIDRSLFAYDLARQDIIARNPELGLEYAKVKRAYWTDQALWVMDTLGGDAKNPVERQALAMALYFDATDAVVRNTILQYIIMGTTAREARMAFLMRIMTDRETSVDAIVSALRLYGKILRDDQEVAALLVAIAEDERTDRAVKIEALRAVLENRFALKHNRPILMLIREIGDTDLENRYIRAFARAFGVDHLTVVTEGRPQGGLTFGDVIDLERAREIATSIWRARQSQTAHRNLPERYFFADLRHREDFLPRVVQTLRDLKARGLQLKLDLAGFGAKEVEEFAG